MFFIVLTKNRFVQSLGVGTFFYLLLMCADWGLLFLLRILETFSRWYRYHASPYAFQVAVAAALFYLLVTAAFNSRHD